MVSKFEVLLLLCKTVVELDQALRRWLAENVGKKFTKTHWSAEAKVMCSFSPFIVFGKALATANSVDELSEEQKCALVYLDDQLDKLETLFHDEKLWNSYFGKSKRPTNFKPLLNRGKTWLNIVRKK